MSHYFETLSVEVECKNEFEIEVGTRLIVDSMLDESSNADANAKFGTKFIQYYDVHVEDSPETKYVVSGKLIYRHHYVLGVEFVDSVMTMDSKKYKCTIHSYKSISTKTYFKDLPQYVISVEGCSYAKSVLLSEHMFYRKLEKFNNVTV